MPIGNCARAICCETGPGGSTAYECMMTQSLCSITAAEYMVLDGAKVVCVESSGNGGGSSGIM